MCKYIISTVLSFRNVFFCSILIFSYPFVFAKVESTHFLSIIERAYKANRVPVAVSALKNQLKSSKSNPQFIISQLELFLMNKYNEDIANIKKYKDIDDTVFEFIKSDKFNKCPLDCVRVWMDTNSYYMSPTQFFSKWENIAKNTPLIYRVIESGSFSLNNSMSDIESICTAVLDGKKSKTVFENEEKIPFYFCNKVLKNNTFSNKIFGKGIHFNYNEFVSGKSDIFIDKPEYFVEYMINAVSLVRQKNSSLAIENLKIAATKSKGLIQKAIALTSLFHVTKDEVYLEDLKKIHSAIQYSARGDGLKYFVEAVIDNKKVNNDNFINNTFLKSFTNIFL